MFTVFQKLSFGLSSNTQAVNKPAKSDLPVVRTPNLDDSEKKSTETLSYGCLSDIFGELVDEQRNSLSKW